MWNLQDYIPPHFIRDLTNEAQNLALTTTAKLPTTLSNQEVVILDKECMVRVRGVQEAIWKRVEQPALNKKGTLKDYVMCDIIRLDSKSSYSQLSHALDEAIRSYPPIITLPEAWWY